MVRAQPWYCADFPISSGVMPWAQLAKQVASAAQPSKQRVTLSQPLPALQAEAALAHALSAQAKQALVSKPELDDPAAPLRFTHTLLRQSSPALQVLLA